jgi:hypothetical protein
MNLNISCCLFIILPFLAACSVKNPSESQTFLPTPPGETAASTAIIFPEGPDLSDFPFERGNTWIYDSSNYEVQATGQLTATYTITETVVDAHAQGLYWIAQIHHEEQLESSSPGWSQPPRTSSDFWYLIKDNQLYRQDHLLNLDDSGSLRLDTVFPLGKGVAWCPVKNLPLEKCVKSGKREVLEASSHTVPAGSISSCYKINEDFNTGRFSQWFCPGIGVVERQMDHNGFQSGSHQYLTSFSLQPGIRPALSVSSTQSPAATPTPRWVIYETALANAILGPDVYPPGSDKGLCEWEIWGQAGRQVYVWAICQVASTDQGTAGSLPAVIYLNAPGSIQQVIIPASGFDYGRDIQQLFPPHVQNRIFNDEFNAVEAMQHIAYRRSHPGTPPAIVESGIPLP